MGEHLSHATPFVCILAGARTFSNEVQLRKAFLPRVSVFCGIVIFFKEMHRMTA
jgi:hypothetical protein